MLTDLMGRVPVYKPDPSRHNKIHLSLPGAEHTVCVRSTAKMRPLIEAELFDPECAPGPGDWCKDCSAETKR